MCLYPILIKNKKYEANKKNKGSPPETKDPRTRLVPVKCGKCMECRKAISREWQIRLQEEIKKNKEVKFVTLTFSEEKLWKLQEELHSQESNEIATIAVRRLLERWRKKYKKSVKHWLCTELGHTGTERLHLHGLLWTNNEKENLERLWAYGGVYVGDYVNSKTVNYIVKYITKLDNDHKGFQGKILCSPGIGKGYENRWNAKQNTYRDDARTNETYTLNNGQKVALPIYYRNKIYTEEEREKLWLEKLDKKTRYVNGVKIRVRNRKEELNYYNQLEAAQKLNKLMGYGDRTWRKKDYAASKKLIENLED